MVIIFKKIFCFFNKNCTLTYIVIDWINNCIHLNFFSSGITFLDIQHENQIKISRNVYFFVLNKFNILLFIYNTSYFRLYCFVFFFLHIMQFLTAITTCASSQIQ